MPIRDLNLFNPCVPTFEALAVRLGIERSLLSPILTGISLYQ